MPGALAFDSASSVLPPGGAAQAAARNGSQRASSW